MPLPKRQHSKTRGRKRRTHWKVSVASLRACPQCAKAVLSHRVCPFADTIRAPRSSKLRSKVRLIGFISRICHEDSR